MPFTAEPSTTTLPRTRTVASENPQFNIRLDDTTREMLLALQDRYGLSQAGIVKMLIRDRVQELKQKEGFSGKRRLGGR